MIQKIVNKLVVGYGLLLMLISTVIIVTHLCPWILCIDRSSKGINIQILGKQTVEDPVIQVKHPEAESAVVMINGSTTTVGPLSETLDMSGILVSNLTSEVSSRYNAQTLEIGDPVIFHEGGKK